MCLGHIPKPQCLQVYMTFSYSVGQLKHKRNVSHVINSHMLLFSLSNDSHMSLSAHLVLCLLWMAFALMWARCSWKWGNVSVWFCQYSTVQSTFVLPHQTKGSSHLVLHWKCEKLPHQYTTKQKISGSAFKENYKYSKVAVHVVLLNPRTGWMKGLLSFYQLIAWWLSAEISPSTVVECRLDSSSH